MRNIIVPTDFSDNAKNALRFAINIANHFEAQIHLIHIFQVRSNAGMLMNIRDFMRRDSEEQLAATIKSVSSSLFRGTSLKASALEGHTVDTVCAYANSFDDALIIMGTQGASGLKEIFVGSNASGVMKKSDQPVLVIPNGYQYQAFKKITLAVDADVISNPDIFAPLIKISKAYSAHFHVLHVEQKEEVVAVDAGVNEHLKDLKPTFNLIKSGESVLDTVRHFVEESNTDLLAMVRRERSFLEAIFHSSVTRKEVFDSPVPLLIIKDIY